MKKVFCIILLALLCGGLATACTGQEDGTEDSPRHMEETEETAAPVQVPAEEEEPEEAEETQPSAEVNRESGLHRVLAQTPAGERFMFMARWDGTDTVLFEDDAMLLAVADAMSIDYDFDNDYGITPSDDFAVYIVEDGFLVYAAQSNWGILREEAYTALRGAQDEGAPAELQWVEVEGIDRFDEVRAALREEQGLKLYYPSEDTSDLNDYLQVGYSYDNSDGKYGEPSNGILNMEFVSEYELGEFGADEVFAVLVDRLEADGLLAGAEAVRVGQYNGSGTSFTRSVKLYLGSRMDEGAQRELERLWRQHLEVQPGYDADDYRWTYSETDSFHLAVFTENGFTEEEAAELERLYGVVVQERW